jgi:hypothetical protein
MDLEIQREPAREKNSCAESYWIFEDFASELEKKKCFASLSIEVGSRRDRAVKLLVWTSKQINEGDI